MYKLYYYPLNASMAPHIVLKVLGVDFELLTVDRDNNAQKSKEYLALNPAGRIPTLVAGEQAIFESPAICVYLAETHPEAKLIPSIGDINRPQFFQWLMYLTNTLQAEQMVYFYPARHTSDDSAVDAIRATQAQRVADIFALLDNELVGKDYLVGDSATVCDYFLFMLVFWSDGFKKMALDYPHLTKYFQHLVQDSAVKHVCEVEDCDLSDFQ